jgi:N-acylneuraminate cytidylyltransferase
MRLAIITARGGSKRIPRKNIRDFCGRPIIAYSIDAALRADCFDDVMVSTDDDEIAEIAQRLGASIPFMRSARTADDHTTTAEVLLEVLSEYRERGVEPGVACCIYPTAPFVTPKQLTDALDLLLTRPDTQSVMTIARFSFPIQRALCLDAAGLVSFMDPAHATTRSQDLEAAYHDAGQFYWFRVPEFVATGSLVGPSTVGFVMPEEQVQDIDDEDDWAVAEVKYQVLRARAQK